MEYRVRFIGLSDGQPHTTHPGVIKRNRPRADRALSRVLTPDMDGRAPSEAWIEQRVSSDAEWERVS